MRLPATWRRLSAEQRRERTQQVRMRTAVRRRTLRRPKKAAAQPLDPLESAKVAGLRYVNDDAVAGIRRAGKAPRFRYVLPNGRPLKDRRKEEF